MDRELLTLNMHRAGQQWATCCAMGDYDEANRLATEIEGYNQALNRVDLSESVTILTGMSRDELTSLGGFSDNPWDALKGSPDTSRLGRG